MHKLEADLYKIAAKIENSTDALQLLDFMRSNQNVLAMGMGSLGYITRILSPIFGGRFVYTALSQEESTAPGQMTVEDLRHYRFEELHGSTGIYGLIGDPIDKSLSHISHNA